jgi:hypothetical protein
MSAGLLDPAATDGFGRVHGQIATALRGGGLVLSSQKVVQHAWRVPLLMLPGVLRVDIRAYGDSVQIVLRPLDPHAAWGAERTQVSPWDKRREQAEVPWRTQWLCLIGLEPRGIAARVDVAVTRVEGVPASHVVAHAVLEEADMDPAGSAVITPRQG